MSNSAPENIVIVGASLAGATAATTLRAEGFDGGIHLLGAERHHPYIRPPLSKGFLAGTEERSSLDVESEDWYRENAVDLRLGTRVISIDPAGTSVTTDSGETLGYDALLLATGSVPRRLTIPGSDLGGVLYLRTIDDSVRLRETIAAGGRRVVLVGSGWIGMEVAATARTLGNEVTILERDPIPLAVALGDELGTYFAELHAQHGVRIRPSVVVDSLVGEQGAVTGVRLADGEVVPADVVVVGVGAIPQVDLARDAGLEVDNGIVVDASLRSSDERIFAAGDIANAFHPLAQQHLRSEHWANALTGGAVAAKAMIGRGAVHDEIPYFYTDQFDLGMEYAGFAPLTKDAEIVYRGDRSTGEFIVFWVLGSRVVAGMNVNVWDVNESIQALVRSGEPVDLATLRDPAVPLDVVGRHVS
ncbi:MAG TPA: FAD-dependent oxidoreductase [Leifsonia sp.]|jgi:3-phenylpropionate/trans-cinnamate dioxygenase ferredoxin reductase subunit|nr:FAD-dependent oxidoreductase [Leifsonia sp.]